MKIIGVCGQASAGKDTVAHYIADKGFVHISLGDILREEMRKRDLPIDRASMREFAIAERQKRGAFYPADVAAERVQGATIISGMRNTAEVEYLQNKFSMFCLIAVRAPLRVRYERMGGRNREGDNISFEDFQAQEEAERNNNPETHEVDNVIARAHYRIENSGTLEEMKAQVDAIMEII